MSTLIGSWEITTEDENVALCHTTTEQLLTISGATAGSKHRKLRYADRSVLCEVDAWTADDGTISQVDYDTSEGVPLVGLKADASPQSYDQFVRVDDAIQTACQIVGTSKASVHKWKIVGGWLNGRWVKELIRTGLNYSWTISKFDGPEFNNSIFSSEEDSGDALSWEFRHSLRPDSTAAVRLWIEKLSPLIIRPVFLRRTARPPSAFIQRADGKAVVWPAFADDSVRGVIEHHFCYATDSVCIIFGAQVGPANSWRIKSRWRQGGVRKIANLDELTPASDLAVVNLGRLPEGPETHVDLSSADFLETARDRRFVPSPSMFGKYYRQWLAAMSRCPSAIVGEIPPVNMSPLSNFETPSTIEITAPWLSGLPIENSVSYSNLPR